MSDVIISIVLICTLVGGEPRPRQVLCDPCLSRNRRGIKIFYIRDRVARLDFFILSWLLQVTCSHSFLTKAVKDHRQKIG